MFKVIHETRLNHDVTNILKLGQFIVILEIIIHYMNDPEPNGLSMILYLKFQRYFKPADPSEQWWCKHKQWSGVVDGYTYFNWGIM